MEESLRIGAFCKKFGVSASTVRYYIQEIHSLLTLRRKFNLAKKEDADSYLHLLNRQKERLTERLEKTRQQEALLEQIQKELISSTSDQ